MKTVVLTLTALLCLGATAVAEVFVYKNSLKYKSTGGGGSDKLRGAGWTVITDSGQVTLVLAYPQLKKYVIVPMQSIDFGTVNGPAGKQHTFFIQHDVWTDGNGLTHIDTGGARGANSVIVVNGASWNMPKILKWGGRSLYPASSNGDMKFEESSGVLTFDKKQTAISNAQGEDLNATALRLVDVLVQKGYVDYSAP